MVPMQRSEKVGHLFISHLAVQGSRISNANCAFFFFFKSRSFIEIKIPQHNYYKEVFILSWIENAKF